MTRAIEFNGLTKGFGDVLAVDDLSAVAQPGQVTALLGPNGAGKTTTLRMLLGLVAPSSGTATFGGRRYNELPDPVRQVGAVLEASGYHPGRTALVHLRILATASRLPHDAPERVLAQTGLAADARRRVGGFSLGMRQRLGIAAAMLGDPKCSSWMSRRTASTHRACGGCGDTCAGSRTRVARCSCPAMH